MTKFICDHPWTHFEVNNPNGVVTMCCDNNTPLGNVNDGSITDIWNGGAYQDIRRRMRDDGAHAICPATCPVLNGFKNFQKLDWYRDLDPATTAFENARRNQDEYDAGKLELASLPRWMRFTYSYACNLDCYHCYQREEATEKVKLPEAFMRQVVELSRYYQVLYPFGGEPFLFKPVMDLIESDAVNPACKYVFATNATLLTDRVFQILESREVLLFSVSLDAATAESFAELRLRGRKGDWTAVLDNLRRIRDLRARKPFLFDVSMTLNSHNHDEIERFVDLGIELGAEPLIMLVTNPFETPEFQKEFLHFSAAQFATIAAQIQSGLAKVRAAGFKEAEAALLALRNHLAQHRAGENHLAVYAAKRRARKVFRLLPQPVKFWLRKGLGKLSGGKVV
jgi:sulfatase maturation enzyme AslB (radical SAM superfamily)